MLRLRTFGGLALQGAESAAGPMLQRRALALLAIVAASADVGVSRDKLLLYLWPDSDQERARNALRQLLHGLRKSLAAPEVLLGTGDLRLNPDVIVSDVSDFEGALARGDLEKAADTYKGPFLDGIHLSQAPEFEYWVDRQRADYASRAAMAMERAARDAAGRGELETAVTWWRRLAALEPLNSRVSFELMNALVAARDPAAALQHARVHEALVREELGGEPDPAIAALVERLRTAKPPERRGQPDRPSVPERATELSPRPASLRDRLQAELGTRYAIEQELTPREGTTRVFLGRDLKHDRSVTIKVLHPTLASALDTGRFHREIALTARLQHPNIVGLLDSGEVKAHLWYVCPFFRGETLRDRLARDGRLSLSTVRDISRGIVSALEYAHGQGVVHRDVRPENVLLASGQALLTNLGVARALDAAAGPRLTATGMLVGSPAYMSPEQARDEAVDARSDLYSWGCVLYEMIAGHPVHTGPTAYAILAQRTAGAALVGIRPGPALGGELAAVVEKALAVELERRFATAGDLQEELERAIPTAERKAPPASASTDQVLGRRRPSWVALLAVTLALLAGVLSLIL
jgi:DNA-binding SARP family transcriptional activator